MKRTTIPVLAAVAVALSLCIKPSSGDEKIRPNVNVSTLTFIGKQLIVAADSFELIVWDTEHAYYVFHDKDAGSLRQLLLPKYKEVIGIGIVGGPPAAVTAEVLIRFAAKTKDGDKYLAQIPLSADHLKDGDAGYSVLLKQIIDICTPEKRKHKKKAASP